MTIDDEIVAFARRGPIASVLPLLDHLSAARPDTLPDELVTQADAAIDRLYRAGRVAFAGHRWLSEPPPTVAGFLTMHRADLQFDPATRRWTMLGTAWTANITVR